MDLLSYRGHRFPPPIIPWMPASADTDPRGCRFRAESSEEDQGPAIPLFPACRTGKAIIPCAMKSCPGKKGCVDADPEGFAERHHSAGLHLPETLRGFAVKNASQPGEMPANATTGIKLSIVFGSGAEIGPYKIALLENIRDAGSISGAARHMGIQYKRAWMLLDSINRAFRQPVVKSVIGGAYAGAVLTPFGTDVLDRYRRIAAAAQTAA